VYETRHTHEAQQEDLRRLRKELNRLERRLQSQETRAANQAARAGAVERRLREELAAIKASRTWRVARLLVTLRQKLSWDGIRSLFRKKASSDGAPQDERAKRYEAYLAAHRMTPARTRELQEKTAALATRPRISVVMPVHEVDPALLGAAVDSVCAQIYDNWELCIVDDASTRPDTVKALDVLSRPAVRLERLERNLGIAGATNRAVAMATGDYLAFMDHDDQLAAEALAEVAVEINRSNADFIYSDEDYIDAQGNRTNPHFKPDFSPDLLLSHNYVTHLVVVRRDLLERVGGLRSELDGAQDYDFVLRATEQARNVRHIPKILYHWRLGETSTSANADSKPLALERGRQALNDALERRGQDALAHVDPKVPHFYRVQYAVKDRPLLSILIPFRDEADLLHCVVGDVLAQSSYENFEIVGVNNDSARPETFDAMRDLAGMDERVRFIDYKRPFSFSAVMNHGATFCAGRHLVFLNNDIRILTPDWLEALLEHSQRGEVGAVGGKLYYPDERVQHAGIIVGIDRYAGHSHKGFPADHQGYFNRLRVVQNVSAVTGAFMMVEKAAFDAVNGFDETHFAVACNDVDLCLRLRRRGLWNIFTPYAEACHLESASRGYEDTPEKRERFAREKAVFAERHRAVLERGDPFYNPNLTRQAEDFSIRVDEA